MRSSCLWFLAALAGCGGSDGGTAPDDVLVVYPDEDGDGIMDHHEAGWGDSLDGGGTVVTGTTATGTTATAPTETTPAFMLEDFDGDGTPNYQDTDSDDDGIPDAEEAGDADLFTLPLDSDLDTWPNFLDLDSDDNCIDDAIEGGSDPDGDNWADFRDLDNDGDGILDATEIGSGCEMFDTDDDGIPDFADQDSDADGIADLWEGATTEFDREPADTDGDGVPDFRDLDSDGDGFSDADESGGGQLWEAPRDTDGDGVGDYADSDSDGDGLSDYDELNTYGTDPLSGDSDGDTFSDGAEVGSGSNPLDPGSIIEGIYVVVPERTDVLEVFSFELGIQRGDVAFLLDTTCSMGGTLNAMSAEFAQIVTDLSAVIPDANYGVGSFDDYNYGAMGGFGDKPFWLNQQVTDNDGAVQATLNSLGLHNGGDLPESAGEAIYQSLSGAGYDQNCNGAYDAATDVLPFLASGADPFFGAAGQHFNGGVSGTGNLGGMGFRPSAMPIVVYATDNALRNAPVYATPGGCPADASSTMVSNAAAALGAKLVGVCVNFCGSTAQMTTIAQQTNSYADLDGGGVSNDPLVFSWSGSNAAFRNTIVGAIGDLAQSVGFGQITLEVVGDSQGFVVDIDPAVHTVTGAVAGQSVDFTLTFRGADAASENDELHALTLNVYGDGTVLLDTLDIIVLVPGVDVP